MKQHVLDSNNSNEHLSPAIDPQQSQVSILNTLDVYTWTNDLQRQIFTNISSEERESLKFKFGITDQELNESLDKLKAGIDIYDSNNKGLGISSAFADAVMDYQVNKIDQMALLAQENNPTIWQQISDFFDNTRYYCQYGADWIKTHWFDQSDMEKLTRMQDRISDSNIRFFNGSERPDELSYVTDPGVVSIFDPNNYKMWHPDEEVIVVSLSDKAIAMGTEFFAALGGGDDSALPTQRVIDSLGNRFNDPRAGEKAQAYFSMLNAGVAALSPLINGEGVYHISVDRYGLFITNPQDARRWEVYVDIKNSETGEVDRTYIQDPEFAKELLKKAGINK